MKRLRLAVMIILPVLLLGAGGLATRALILSFETPEAPPREVEPPLVRVVPARLETMRLIVQAEGTVAPRTESQLVAEVSGRVVEVSPSLAAGGFFEADDVLLRIERREYELAITRARAAIEQAKLRLTTERETATVARREWEELGKGEPSPLLFREPQIAEVQASLAAAEAGLRQAQYDLERTVILAPFAGRVRSKQVDVGQYVQRGMAAATLYSVDVAEVRLPIPNAELEYCNLPLAYRDGTATADGPAVRLMARFAGRDHVWRGRIVRTEGEIDARTRMVNAIAQVADPYAQGSSTGRPPLAVGMFVQAEIDGRVVRDVVALPRTALRSDSTVFVIDSADRLRFREVDVLRRQRERVLVRAGLEDGERVCVSTLETAVNGMQVQVTDAPDSEEGQAARRGGAS